MTLEETEDQTGGAIHFHMSDLEWGKKNNVPLESTPREIRGSAGSLGRLDSRLLDCPPPGELP